MFKQLYLRIRYRKQLKQGFGLLHDHGAKRNFAIMNGRAFIMNGVDPLVRVDLTNGKAEQYQGSNIRLDNEGIVRPIDPNKPTQFTTYYPAKDKQDV